MRIDFPPSAAGALIRLGSTGSIAFYGVAAVPNVIHVTPHAGWFGATSAPPSSRRRHHRKFQ
ncbi:MAG TPA: hypothetical protein VF688_10325 [Allosphingosinicella sp.]|jgi:hypothetical protein